MSKKLKQHIVNHIIPTLRIVLIVSVCLLYPFTATSQSTIVTDSLSFKPLALPLIQIPEYGKRTRKLISDIQLKPSDYKSLNEISQGIGDVSKTLDDKLTFLNDSLSIQRLDRLDKEKRELSLLNESMTQWKTTLGDIINKGQSKDSMASNMIRIWQITLDTITATQKPDTNISETSGMPDDLRTEVINYITSLQSSQKRLMMHLDSVQQIQTVIAISESKLGSISDLIESYRTKLKQNMWIAELPPIWKLKRDTLEPSIRFSTTDFIDSNTNIIKAFFNNNPKLPYYFTILFILVFGLIVYIKLKAKALYKDFPEEFKEANIVLKYPLIATLFILWFITVFFTLFPKELNDLISILMFLPLVIMLRKLNPNWKWQTILLFSCSYLLFLFVKELDYTYMPQRILLIIINLLTLLLIFYYSKQKQKIKELSAFWQSILPFFINLFMIMVFISLIASIFGNIQLSLLLTYVTLGVILTMHVLRAAIQLVESFVFLILMGPLMNYSNILKEDGKVILEKMDKLFRFIAFAALVYIIIDLLNIRKEAYQAVVGIIEYHLTVGKLSISLGNFLAFFLTIQIAVWLSSIIRYVLEKEVFPRTHFKQGVPNTILIMTKFTFVILGVLFAFAAAGIQIDKLAILMGALGVGIGFGLQNIINNFVSGIILALERPLTIGDIIDLPDVSGTVKDIGLRASTIRTWEGSDVVVPNGSLISNKLTNWTLFDRRRRVKVEVRVPFDTNIEKVSKLLLSTANEIPEAMKKPGPYLNLKGIGTSAMEINLYCWISDTDNIFSYGTAIRKAVYKALVDAGYDIPVPKQDLIIDPKIDTEVEKS